MVENINKKYQQRLENKKTQSLLFSKYHKAFHLHEWLLEHCMKCMDERNIVLDNLVKHVVYLLFLKAFKTFWSILILCKQGFGIEASLILRTLLNNLIALLYVAKDSGRAIRYADFESVSRKFALDLLKTSKTLNKNKKEELEKIEEELNKSIEQIKTKYRIKNPRPRQWTELLIKDMAKDVGRLDDYKNIYGQLSEIEHSGPGSVQRYAKIRGSDVVLEPGPSEEMIEIVLFTSFKYMLDILGKTDEIVGLNAEVLLKEADERIRDVYRSFILAYS